MSNKITEAEYRELEAGLDEAINEAIEKFASREVGFYWPTDLSTLAARSVTNMVRAIEAASEMEHNEAPPAWDPLKPIR